MAKEVFVSDQDKARLLAEYEELQKKLGILPGPKPINTANHTKYYTGIPVELVVKLNKATAEVHELSMISKAWTDPQLSRDANRYVKLRELLKPAPEKKD